MSRSKPADLSRPRVRPISFSSAERYLLPAILMVAGVLRVYRLDFNSLWLDEAFSIYVASQPLDRMLDIIVKHDTPPPLYYTLLHYWLGFGDTPLIARLLSALFGIVSVGVIYLIGKELVRQSVGAIAAILLAVSPFHIWYSQETRMYSLLLMLCSLSAFFLLRALRAGGKGYWIAYVASTALATYTQISSFFFIIGEWAAVSLYIANSSRGFRLSPLLRPWLLSQAALLLLWMPWLPGFIRQSQTYQQFWIDYPTPDTVTTLLFEFSSAYLPHWKIPYGRESLIAITAILALLAARRCGRREYLYLLSLFVAPIAAMYLFSLAKPIFLPRALIFCITPFILLVACGIAGLSGAKKGYAVLAALVLLNLISLYRVYTIPMKEEWDRAARYVAARANSGDIVLFIAADTQIPFDYYIRDSDIALERRGLPVDVFTKASLEPPVAVEDLPGIDRLIAGRGSFWLIVSHSKFPDPEGIVRSYADSAYQRVEHEEFRGIEISRYTTDK